jgi:transcriptional regulator with XRE-family HTH domain
MITARLKPSTSRENNDGSQRQTPLHLGMCESYMTVINSKSCEDEKLILASEQPDDSGSSGALPRKVEERPDSKEAIGQRIKEARLRAGLHQFEIAERCGVSRAAVSNWEHGQGIRSQKLIEYARVVGVPAEWLITGGRIAASEQTSSANLDPIQLQRLIAASFQLLGKTQGQAEEWSKAILKASERPPGADQEAHEPTLTQRLAQFLMRMYAS